MHRNQLTKEVFSLEVETQSILFVRLNTQVNVGRFTGNEMPIENSFVHSLARLSVPSLTDPVSSSIVFIRAQNTRQFTPINLQFPLAEDMGLGALTLGSFLMTNFQFQLCNYHK